MRTIDADALMERTEILDDVFVTDWTTAKVQLLIKEAPTIDAEQVRHARFAYTLEPAGPIDVPCGECSNCHECFIIDEDCSFEDFGLWNYCPNCGAKMDLEGE